jgi:ABC-2 type transport system ATP-binding protein
MTSPAITVDHVSKRYRLYIDRNQSLKAAFLHRGRATYDEFLAIDDVSFEVRPGQTFGLVGENGSGKSTMLKCIAKILRPDRGSIRIDGKVAALLELGSGFHPELSGRENVFLNGSILGQSKKEIERKFDAILDFAGVEKFIDQPVKTYSSGMYVRLGFSVAIHVDPDILLVDEILAVGDAAFQTKCMEKFLDFRRQGRTVVVVSHAMGQMRSFCDEVAWLDHGKLMAVGRPEEVIDEYVDETHDERKVLTDGLTHWGSGEARITKVELLGGTGERRTDVTRFRTGDPFTIRLTIESTERIPGPVIGLSIENLDGVNVWSHHTRDGVFEPDAIEGISTIDYVVPSLMLQPGTYEVQASIADHTTTHLYDYVRGARRFDVDHGLPRESGGFAVLGGTFGNLSIGTPARPARRHRKVGGAAS